MSPLKRPIDTPTDQEPAKVQRAGSSDFSGSVKKRLSVSARTGQACDRCKVRKIRCDARPGGCSPCAQSNAECKTTDRITGRATSRGHVDSLESENVALRQEVEQLRRRLQEQASFGSGMAESHRSSSATLPSHGDEAHTTTTETQSRPYDPHSLANILNPAPQSPVHKADALPQYDPERVGDNYLGVSSANDWPCPASGSSFSLFGMKLDLKDFVSYEDAELAKFTTYQSFFTHAFDEPRREKPPVPSYQQTRVMCEYWFKLGGSFLPVLHKPHFLNMMERFYKEPDFQLSEPETIQFHCMIAMMQYQLEIRSREQTTLKWSEHYLYAIGYYTQLLRSSDMPSMQALVMIMCVLRNFQRPGAYWIVSAQVLLKLVEAGYHRSVRAWQLDGTNLTAHEIEMRKRIFWTVLQCHASLAVRLGRPMLMRLDDFDNELPQIIPDNLPEETNLPEHRKCSFLAGITFFKLLIIQLQIYGQLLCIRPPRQDYEALQKRLGKQMDYWESSKPAHLVVNDNLPLEDKAFTLYLSFGHQGARLLLHHPAFLRKPNEALMKKDLDACLDASSKLLAIGKELKALKVLDATWHNTTYYFNAIFTSLFAHSYRRESLTIADLAALKADMTAWVDVMSGIGNLLGSGDRLPTALRHIMGTTIADISRHVHKRLGIPEPERPVSKAGIDPVAPLATEMPSFGMAPVNSNLPHSDLRESLVHVQPHAQHPPQPPQVYEPYPVYQAPVQFDPTAYPLDLTQQASHQPASFYVSAASYAQPSSSAWREFTDHLGHAGVYYENGTGFNPAETEWQLAHGQQGKVESPQQESALGTMRAMTDWDGMPRDLISWPTGQPGQAMGIRGGQGAMQHPGRAAGMGQEGMPGRGGINGQRGGRPGI